MNSFTLPIGVWFAALLAGSVPLCAQTSLVRNGGFEGTFSATGVGQSWVDNSASFPVTVAYAPETANPHSGFQAQRITCTAFTSGAVQFRQPAISIAQGNTYRVQLALRSEALDSVVEVQLRKVAAPYTIYMNRFFRTTNDWQVFEFEAEYPVTDATASLFVRIFSTGTLWVDDVAMFDLGHDPRPIVLTPPAEPMMPRMFGLHVHNIDAHPPVIPFYTWRLWDTGVSWPQLEPAREEWNFDKLDHYVDLAEVEDIQIVLPLGLSPKWASARPNEKSAYNKNPASGNDTGWAAEPADIQDWRDYVRTVAERYRGRIRHYEIWNEVNQTGFFSGTMAKLLELQREAYQILKEVDPKNQVIAPSVIGNVGYFELLHRKGAAQWCDIANFHFYNFDQPEKFISTIQNLRALMSFDPLASKPLWNTEYGWNILPLAPGVTGTNPITAAVAGDYIARSYILYWALGAERSCLYAWDNGNLGLMNPRDGTIKTEAATAYAEIVEWLSARTMIQCGRSADGVWMAVLRHGQRGRKDLIVWVTEGERTWTVPIGFNISTVRRLSGLEVPLSGNTVTISTSPVLLR